MTEAKYRELYEDGIIAFLDKAIAREDITDEQKNALRGIRSSANYKAPETFGDIWDQTYQAFAYYASTEHPLPEGLGQEWDALTAKTQEAYRELHPK
jgi:hypothetical protein